MSKNLADIIEDLILRRLIKEESVLISRNQLAQQLNCAPSQISYVLQSRFTRERGFELHSRRGAGGFVRIGRYVECEYECSLQQQKMLSLIKKVIDEYELEIYQIDVLNSLSILLEQQNCSCEQLEWICGALVHIVGMPEDVLWERM